MLFTSVRKFTGIKGLQGTGLGMTITKNLVDTMDGTILVHSEAGKDSEFVVSLNFAEKKRSASL